MDPIIFLFGIGTTVTLLVLTLITFEQTSKSSHSKLPPGKFGWPIIGETLTFVSYPRKFIRDRMITYSPGEIFKTSLAGEKMFVFCGPDANKFIFLNEGKLVSYWLPKSIAAALSCPNKANNSKPTHDLSYKFLRHDSIQHHVPIVHSMVQQHLGACWFPNSEVQVYTLAKEFTFALSCRVLINASQTQVVDIAKPFYLMLEGILSVPINLPGTSYYKAMKGGRLAREKLIEIIKQRRKELTLNEGEIDSNGSDDDANRLDLLSRLIIDSNETGKSLSEEDIASKIIGLMFAGFYPTSTTIAFMISNLAEHPDVHEKVLQEQLEIAQSKGAGEPLTWADLQKMKYSWNVICETMRLKSPVPGNFRVANTDFNYAGFDVPKGWKIHWSLHSTHTNPEYFPEPEKFEPSRFEGNGPAPYTYVPFGAGARMCVGKEFARIELLVFLHNVVTKFKFKKVNPNEKVYYNPDPIPSEGMRILLEANE